MKIVHTSDWHVGRRWKGIQRLDEIEAVLDHLAEFIEREAVDLVLHTGDVFDRRNPPAEAERLVNRFFVRVGKAGAHMVVIAGNHDDAQRLDARSLLAEYANVQILGRDVSHLTFAPQDIRTIRSLAKRDDILDILGLIADDDDDSLDSGRANGVNNPFHHWSICNRMGDLWKVAGHARTFPRGENDRGQGSG